MQILAQSHFLVSYYLDTFALAITCTLTATVYIALTAICVDAVAPMLPGDLASTVLLWAIFNIVLMGGRGLFNGLRIRGESWLGQTAL